MKVEVYYDNYSCKIYDNATVDLKHRIVMVSIDERYLIIPFENVRAIKEIEE